MQGIISCRVKRGANNKHYRYQAYGQQFYPKCLHVSITTPLKSDEKVTPPL